MDNAGADAPRSMRDAGVRERRRGMLGMPHVAPLTAYAARLRARIGLSGTASQLSQTEASNRRDPIQSASCVSITGSSPTYEAVPDSPKTC